MSSEAQRPQIDFAVEVGPQHRPILKVRIKDSEIPLGLSVAQAGELGRALLAVSAVCSSPAPQPEGTRIANCHFPVVKWATGRSHANGLPILMVEIVGGIQLAFQFEPRTGEECGNSLRAAAASPSNESNPQLTR
jgi:hypothetical protein